jgi:hypothetical protein
MKRIASVATLVAITLMLGAAIRPSTKPPSELTVHEWGTFTSIAGKDGLAVAWRPLDGPSDLPCFVSRFGGEGYKDGLWGKVRMETPVLYVYSPRAAVFSAKVHFRGGEITEWYPAATVTRSNTPVPRAVPAGFTARHDAEPTGMIEWRNVKVSPGEREDFPAETSRSHYYAARHTDASPLQTQRQHEKFLFYRGVGTFALPISATAAEDGTIRVTDLGSEELGGLVLIVNHGGKFGFRFQEAGLGTAELRPPSMDSDVSSLGRTLERLLVARGLYPKEAAAMVETWRDSWLEEGTRVLYIVPPRTIDEVLPLDVDPTPRQTVRVFVGRIEVLTPTIETEIEQALASHDRATLTRYGRFLQSISDRILARMSKGAARTQMELLLQSIDSARMSVASPCPGR